MKAYSKEKIETALLLLLNMIFDVNSKNNQRNDAYLRDFLLEFLILVAI